MLKGIEKNLKENYNQIIYLKRKDQLKTKDDVPIVEAFELYMLKNFHNIKLNSLTNNMLSFWEKDFEKAIKKHIKFLKENLESQTKYSSKFSKILQEMEIFNNEENEEKAEENKDQEQNNPSNENPRVTTSLNRNGVFSDYFVEDGSYLRIRNVQIGYVLPKLISEKFGSDYVRFYISANNLFTITNYIGYDPDIGAAQGALSNGIDYGFYPQARTVMGGVNIKF